jgi:hypothetical protein
MELVPMAMRAAAGGDWVGWTMRVPPGVERGDHTYDSRRRQFDLVRQIPAQ